MTASSTVECDAIWLQLQNYHVMPLNDRVGGCAELERAIQRGIPARPDLRRDDFYDLELGGGRAYVHVHHDLQTVYLVAYLG